MARTKRRKSGYRWFAEKRPDWVLMEDYVKPVRAYDSEASAKAGKPQYVPRLWRAYCYTRAEYDKKQIALYESDRAHSFSSSADIKAYDNSARRARQRQQLSKIIKGQEHYDFSFEEAYCKGLAWILD